MSTLTGDEPFHSSGQPLPFTVADFWRWGVANLAGNALRGLVAEFLVARAVQAPDATRVEWDAIDLRTPRGTSIEVKCSGYLQTWAQAALSRPSFDIAQKRSWYAATNSYSATPTRAASLYVFALHHHKDRPTLDPRDVTQWSFYVVATRQLNEAFPATKRVALTTLHTLAGPPVGYTQLADRVRDLELQLEQDE